MPRSNDRAQGSSHGESAAPQPLYRRISWWGAGIILLTLISALFAVDPIRDAVTRGPVGEGRLELPTFYVAIAPLSDVLDTVTLLAVGQHIALLLWVIAIFALVRVRIARRRATSMAREAIAALILLVVIVVAYVCVALLPRPMAKLVLSDDTVFAADFHAHTMYSHDGRSGWTDDDVRAWHRDAGYDVAYITDHATYEGAERGIAGNAAMAGEGTMLFQGLEAIYRGEHVNVLSVGRRVKGLTTPDLKDVDEQALMLASILPATTPVIIETIPGNLDHVKAATDTNPAGMRAIELVDGSPRGLTQGRRDRARILRMADSLNLALVVGTDNHGYGRTAPGWTLLRFDGWRGARTDSLSVQIEEILRVARLGGTKIVERRVADGTGAFALLFAGPAIAWRMFTTIAPEERVSWIVWTCLVLFAIRSVRVGRARRTAA